MADKKFWEIVRNRLLENFLSVKVWFFIFPFIASTLFLLLYMKFGFYEIEKTLKMLSVGKDISAFVLGIMNGLFGCFTSWLTFNVSLVGTIVVVREIFKVKKLKMLAENKKVDEAKRILL